MLGYVHDKQAFLKLNKEIGCRTNVVGISAGLADGAVQLSSLAHPVAHDAPLSPNPQIAHLQVKYNIQVAASVSILSPAFARPDASPRLT